MMVVLNSKVLKQHVLIMVSVKFLCVKIEFTNFVSSHSCVKSNVLITVIVKSVKTTFVKLGKC